MRNSIALAFLLGGFLVFGQPIPSHAGCGCDKPPPVPAAIIPNVAFPGMPVTLFHDNLQVGQTWTVVFHSGSDSASVRTAVVLKRALTDPSGSTVQPQLVVTIPVLPFGPTRIEAFSENASFIVPEESFTMIGKPVMAAEQTGQYLVKNYTTGIGRDGTLYVSLGGLRDVCQPMEFQAFAKNYPLRFTHGTIAILNWQGFFIDAFHEGSADYFSVRPQKGGPLSDRLLYSRHSFERYCAAHQPGRTKEVDPQDPNWHLDGTPHTDYSTLILAISGRLDDGTLPQAGQVSFDLMLHATLGDYSEPWAWEREEEIFEEKTE
jgi:hypothetical protein